MKLNSGSLVLVSALLAISSESFASDWGYIDKQGTVVINAKFDGAKPFSEGLAPVLLGEKWGYIDRSGNVIIASEFDTAIPFHEGLAAVLKDGSWGYIKPDGSFKLKPSYANAWPFTEGVARVSSKQAPRNYFFIDQDGKRIISPKQNWDFNGDPTDPFSDGLAMVGVDYSYKTKYGFIDHSGAWAISSEYDGVGSFSGGLAPFWKGGLVGYFDHQAQPVIPPIYHYGHNFSEGLALVQNSKGKWEFIDIRGNVIFSIDGDGYGLWPAPGIDYLNWGFSEGLAPVYLSDQWVFVDKTGKTVIDGSYSSLLPFSEGLAPVEFK
ncbi:WG repeat-containing protein [Neptuniibacter halophilus]|uniref:WG repeat-containing protein n=1 Tax=Neptuniibacter halophilus TaxID=651666 RepID=UPI0025733E0E|nr:WG repeat-containing protein [Neptuniibacter halophilus]